MNPPAQFKCPGCKAPLSMDDINVSTDVALCRACNRISKFSELINEHVDDEIIDSPPPRIRVGENIRGLEMQYIKAKGIGFFLIPFTLFWNGITWAGVYGMLTDKDGPEIGLLLFMIPFVLVGLGTFFGAAYTLFGRYVLTITPGRGELFRGIAGIGRRQPFHLEKDARITIEPTNMRQNERVLYKIVVEQPHGKPFEFGTAIHEEESKQYVVALLRRMRA